MKLTKIIERWNTDMLIEFFQQQPFLALHLEGKDYKTLRQAKITGTSFLHASKDDLFRIDNLPWGYVMEVNKLREKILDLINNETKNPEFNELESFITEFDNKVNVFLFEELFKLLMMNMK